MTQAQAVDGRADLSGSSRRPSLRPQVETVTLDADPSSRVAWICLAAGLVLSILLGLLSEGGYHDDGLTHYLYARWAWGDPRYLVDEWGRPGQTCLLFPIAWLGWTTCRMASALLSAGSAWLAWDIARKLGLRWSAAVPLLCFIQPLFLLASYTTLTETAAAFYLVLALWCYVRGRLLWSALVLSLCFVTRYELLALAPLWAMALWCKRARWSCYVVLAWAPLLHNLVGLWVLGRWPIEFIVSASHPQYYGTGTPLTMLVKSMGTCGPPVAVLALVGLMVRWPGRGAWLVPASYALYLLAHSVIFTLGAYASGGYPRFLVTTSPVAAICAVVALGALTSEQSRPRRQALVALAVVAALMVAGVELETSVTDESWLFLIDKVRPIVWAAAVLVITSAAGLLLRPNRLLRGLLTLGAVATTALPLGYLVRPHPLSAEARAIRDAAVWLAGSSHADAPVISASIWASYFLDRGYNVVPPQSADILAGAHPGTVFIWDAAHAPHPRFGLTTESMRQRSSWHLVWESAQRAGGQPAGRIYVSD